MKEENWIQKDISILVIGYDGYKDVWDRFFELLNKNWPDRPKTYLACSELSPVYDKVEIIHAGKNAEWSKKVEIALERIKTKYVLLMLEDFFVIDRVDNKIFEETIELIDKNGIKFYQVLVQLINQKSIKGAPFDNKKYIHIIPEDKRYPINLQAAIWNKDFLEKCVGNGNYNAWMFELNQIKLNEINKNKIEYLIDDRNICNILHAVVQSKYLRNAKAKLKRIGYIITDEERESLSYVENFKYMFKLYMYEITPTYLVKYAKKIGKMMRIDFVTDRLERK